MKKSDTRNFISPSRLNLFLESKEKYLRKYLFKEPQKESVSMRKGKEIHSLFYQIAYGRRRYVAEKDFGHLRATKKTSPTIASMNKVAKALWEEKNKSYTILNEDFFGMSERIISFFMSNPKTHKLAKKGVRNNTYERLIFCEKQKLKGYPDLVGNGYMIDIKTTAKEDWIEEGKASNFFKGEYRKAAFQQIIYQSIMENVLKTKFDFSFLLILTKPPYTVKLTSIPEEYIIDIYKLMKTKLLPQVENFNNQVSEKVGFEFPGKKPRGLNKKKTWARINEILGQSGDQSEVIDIPLWERRDLDIELGYAKTNEEGI